MGEDVQTQGRQDLLTGLLQDHGLEVGTDHADDQNAGIHRNQSEQIGQFKLILDGTLDVTDQQGRDHVVANGDDHDQQHCQKILPVGLGVNDQPFDQFAVFHVAVEAYGLFLVFHGEIGHNEGDGESTNNGANDQKG